MNTLIASFEKVIKDIRHNGCVSVETPNGWYHTYQKAVVDKRVSDIRNEIDRLTDKYEQQPTS